MGKQVELERRARCTHEAGAREPIYTEGGRRIAERCGACHRVVQIRPCAGCRRYFRLTAASAKRGRIYHSEKCRRRAARRRAVERAISGRLDPRDT